MKSNYDVAIIGGGPGGYVAAIQASKLGLNTVLIEQSALGGVCLNWGCIPTKSLLKISEEYRFITKKAQNIGIELGEINFDINKAVKFSRDSVQKLTSGIDFLMKKNKITVIKGRAKIAPNKDIIVDGKNIKSKNIIIATGSYAREIPDLKIDGNLIWDAKCAMTPTKVPKSILIVGSGAIGMEFASFYNAIGSKVTVVEIVDQILSTEDEEIGLLARKSFEDYGIIVHTDSKISSVQKKRDTVIANIIQNNKDNFSLEVEHIIVAAGVVGNSQNLGLENLKAIKIEKSWIKTNEYFETGEKNIYAIGDVRGTPCLAHKASHEGMLVAKHIAGIKTAPMTPIIPSCIYSNPQIASMGMTEKQALANGHDIKIGRARGEGNGKSIAIGNTNSLVKIIFDKNNGELLGAHMLGCEVTEMIQGLVIAKNLEATEECFRDIVFPHPTISEMIYEAILDVDGDAIHG